MAESIENTVKRLVKDVDQLQKYESEDDGKIVAINGKIRDIVARLEAMEKRLAKLEN